MQHQVKKTEAGYQCEICGWQWKSKPSSGTCPGVKRYAWGSAPETLLTANQLKKRKLKPGGAACGVVMGQYGDHWLYDSAQALPFSADELAAEKERRRKARYATCRWCKREVRKQSLDAEYGACQNCLPHARETAQSRREAARQAMRQRDKAEQARWAADLLAREDWVVLDTETTGLDDMAEIVSLCILAPDGRVLLNSLVKPMQAITHEASQVNGLTAAMLEDAPDFRDLLAQAQAIMTGKTIVAYNADFDKRMLYQTCRMRGLSTDWLLAADWQCAMNAYAAWYGEWRDGYGTYRWQRLPGGNHSAAGDCQATLTLIRHMTQP